MDQNSTGIYRKKSGYKWTHAEKTGLFKGQLYIIWLLFYKICLLACFLSTHIGNISHVIKIFL